MYRELLMNIHNVGKSMNLIMYRDKYSYFWTPGWQIEVYETQKMLLMSPFIGHRSLPGMSRAQPGMFRGFELLGTQLGVTW